MGDQYEPIGPSNDNVPDAPDAPLEPVPEPPALLDAAGHDDADKKSISSDKGPLRDDGLNLESRISSAAVKATSNGSTADSEKKKGKKKGGAKDKDPKGKKGDETGKKPGEKKGSEGIVGFLKQVPILAFVSAGVCIVCFIMTCAFTISAAAV